MGKEKITYEQMCDPAFRRKELMKDKQGAVWQIFFELGGIINVSKFARKYFKKTHGWFMQRVNGYDVNHKRAEFTEEQYQEISQGFRNLAKILEGYADELDKAGGDKD